MRVKAQKGSNNGQRYLKIGLHVAILLGVAWATLKYVNAQEVLAALRTFNYGLAPLLLALSLAELLLKAVRFHLLLQPFGQGISWATGIKLYIAGQGATVLPGGVAARAGLLNQVGVPISEASVPVLANSMADQFFFIMLGLLAALWYPQARTSALFILALLLVVGLLFAIKPSRVWLSQMAQRIAARLGLEEPWRNFLSCLTMLRSGKIALTTFVTTALAFAVLVVILRLSLQGVGQSVSFPVALLAYIIPTMVARLLPIPAGLGVTEATMVGFLTASAGVDTNSAVAGAAIFRIVAIFLPILFGALVYFFFWRSVAEKGSHAPQSVEKVHASNPDL